MSTHAFGNCSWFEQCSPCDESQILHAAAGILRRQIWISDITISDDEYPTPEEVSISKYGAKLPSSLKIFMCWLLDDSAFKSANDSTSVPIGKLRKCLSLAECIVSVSKNKFTSFHFHRCFGSLCALLSTDAAHRRAVVIHWDCICFFQNWEKICFTKSWKHHLKCCLI